LQENLARRIVKSNQCVPPQTALICANEHKPQEALSKEIKFGFDIVIGLILGNLLLAGLIKWASYAIEQHHRQRAERNLSR